MRHLALYLCNAGHYPLSIGDQCILREITFSYQGGRVDEYPSYLKPIDSLELGVHHFSRAFGCEVQIQKGDHRFAAFRRTLQLRHTLTHPKNAGDLALSSDHIRDFADAIAWFSAQMVLLFSASFSDILNPPAT